MTVKRDGVARFRKAFPQAQSMWDARVPRVGMLEMFLLNGKLVLIHDYIGGDGWNIFIPATDDGRIYRTLQAVADYCGVEMATEEA